MHKYKGKSLWCTIPVCIYVLRTYLGKGLISKIMLYWPLLSTRKRNNFYHSPNRFARLEFRILARVRYEKRAGLEGLLIIHRRLLTKRVFLPKRQ